MAASLMRAACRCCSLPDRFFMIAGWFAMRITTPAERNELSQLSLAARSHTRRPNQPCAA
jgi:hypothetical protein